MKNIKPTYVGLTSVGLGLLFILVAWIRAANLNYVDGQVPLLISGGAGGLAFIAIGTSVLLFESGRRARAHLEEKIDQLIDAVRTAKPATSNGNAPVATARTVSIAIPNGSVVVGRSSFHRPDCRLVEGKDGLDYAPLADATARGLTPCRVCDPTGIEGTQTAAAKRARR